MLHGPAAVVPHSRYPGISSEGFGGTAAQGQPIQRGSRLPHFRRRSGIGEAHAGRVERGQSLVEFALVLPMLLVLLLGIADFGRIFQAGIVTETAARNGAETAALERLRAKPPTDSALRNAYYDNLHLVAARAACREARVLANTTFDAATGTCGSMPLVRACVHDGVDPTCGNPIPGFSAAVPAGCADLDGSTAPWDPASAGDTASHAVEVRVCYQFTTLFNLHVSLPMNAGLNLGDIWIERTRYFVLDCPPGSVATC